MKAKFRITDELGPSSVNLGRIVSPALTADNTIVSYDYSGFYQDNVSTFPGRSRYLSADYDIGKEAWYLRSVYASDVKITNRLLVKRGVSKAIPLYNVFQSRFPHRSNVARYDLSSGKIDNPKALLDEILITDKEGLKVDHSHFLYDVEFIPANEINSNINSLGETNIPSLFYIRIYANDMQKDLTVKVKYTAARLDKVGIPIESEYFDYVSLEPHFSLYNVNYDFRDGVGSSLLGYGYPGAPKNEAGQAITDHIVIDPDKDLRPRERRFSLLYDGYEDIYNVILSDTKKKARYMQKPCPLFSLYFQGSKSINPEDYLRLRVYNEPDPALGIPRNSVVLYFVALNKRVTLTGKSTAQVAYEINKLNAQFDCFPLLPVASLSITDILPDDSAIYGGTTSAVTTTGEQFTEYNLFDQTIDGGIIVRSKKFLARYTVEPTIKAYAPTNKSALYPWTPRIKVGGFVGRTGNIYYVSPFSSQQWSTMYGYPFVDIQQEQVFFKERRTIKVERVGLLNDPRHVKIYDESGNQYSHMIEGIDAMHGYVFLNQNIPTNNALFIDYSYREDMVDVLSLNLNPTKPFKAEPYKLYQLKILPYWSTSFQTSAIPYSMFEVSEVNALPDEKGLKDDSGMILAVFSIVPKIDIAQYKLSQTEVFGGGLDMSLPMADLQKKVPDLDFITDGGTIQGLRYPSNCVVYTRVPAFLKGRSSVVLEDYDPSVILNDRIRIFGAVNIPIGTTISVMVGGSTKTTTIKGFTSTHEAVIDPFTVPVLAGTKVSYNAAVDPVFDTNTIKQALQKTASIETTFIVDYGDQ